MAVNDNTRTVDGDAEPQQISLDDHITQLQGDGEESADLLPSLEAREEPGIAGPDVGDDVDRPPAGLDESTTDTQPISPHEMHVDPQGPEQHSGAAPSLDVINNTNAAPTTTTTHHHPFFDLRLTPNFDINPNIQASLNDDKTYHDQPNQPPTPAESETELPLEDVELAIRAGRALQWAEDYGTLPFEHIGLSYNLPAPPTLEETRTLTIGRSRKYTDSLNHRFLALTSIM